MNITRKLYPFSYNKSRFQKVRDLIRTFLIYYVVVIICIIVVLTTDAIITKIFHHQSIFHTHFDRDEYIKVIGTYKTALLITIIAPVIEEISFRLFLNPTRLNISLSASFFIYMMSGPVCFFGTLENYMIRVSVSIIIFIVLYSIYNSEWSDKLSSMQNKLLFFSSVCFGLVHIYNFSPIYWKLIFLYPIYVSPQLCLGFMAGLIRIRNGIIWAILLHILVNGSSTWPRLLWGYVNL